MTWNYRVLRQMTGGDYSYHIIEAYYKGSEVDMWSDPMSPYGETTEELRGDLKHMAEAFSRPVLEEVNGKLVEVA